MKMLKTRWVDIYNKLLNKILELFPEKKGDVVYHYTSLKVLWEFLRPDYDFLCTYCRSLSDPTEFNTGTFACARMMREFCDDNFDKFLMLLRGANVLSGDSGLNFLPWTMSFSLADDETSQWKNYTDNRMGGCAVGFSVEKIMQDIKKGLTHDDWCFINFLPCVYVGYDSKDLIYKLFKYVMTDVVKDLACMLSHGSNDDQGGNTAQALAFLLLSSIIKHKDFKEEREWRLVMQPIELSKMSAVTAMVGGKIRMKVGLWGGEATDVPTRKVSDCIDRIVISPHGPSENLCKMAEMFLELRAPMGGKRPIIVSSESPYRGEWY